MTWWKNQGQASEPGRFRREVLRGVARPAYAMTWGDLDADGDLDLVAIYTGQQSAVYLNDGSGNFVSEYPPKVAKAENESIDPLQKDWVLKANLNELKSARIKYPDSKFIGLINTRIGTITGMEWLIRGSIRGSRWKAGLITILSKYGD